MRLSEPANMLETETDPRSNMLVDQFPVVTMLTARVQAHDDDEMSRVNFTKRRHDLLSKEGIKLL